MTTETVKPEDIRMCVTIDGLLVMLHQKGKDRAKVCSDEFKGLVNECSAFLDNIPQGYNVRVELTVVPAETPSPSLSN